MDDPNEKRIVSIVMSPVTAATEVGVIALVNERLGEGYLTEADLRLPGVVARCAVSEDGMVVGLCIARQWTVRDFLDHDALLQSSGLLAQLESEDAIGHLKTVVVKPAYEGRGLARQIGLECYNVLREQGVRKFVMTAWKSARGIHVRSIAEAGGFTMLGEIQDYWADGYHCPECGTPCRCSCVIYFRRDP